MRGTLLTLLLLVISGLLAAQTSTGIRGQLRDEQGKPLESVSIRIVESDQYATSGADGKFSMGFRESGKIQVTLQLTSIGYQSRSLKLTVVNGSAEAGIIVLKQLNLSLKEIEVTARSGYEGQSNSSLIISRDVIEQTPALSLTDLLNQLPNRKIIAPSLQSLQNITLRTTFAPTTNGRGPFENNAAFGVAIIRDGNTISNNMNMQSFNPGISGASGSASYISSGSYGLQGSRSNSYSADSPFGGIDLRQIAVNNIESIEVISGVAPAKYGDLTEGAVIIETQAGKSAPYLRMQLRDNATSYSFSQGIKLTERAGALNLGVNYVNSFADNRDKLKAYKRIGADLKWTNSFGKDKRVKNTLAADYSRRLDGVRRDPDALTDDMARFDSWDFSISNRTSYRLNGSFLKNISLNMRYAEGHQVSYTERLSNQPYVLISESTTSGIHEGYFAPGIYLAESLIDGRPINASARLDFSGDFKTGNVVHFLGFGLSYDYGANKGLGQVSDPSRPRAYTSAGGTSTNPSRSERYYDFNLAIAQHNIGAYAEDQFKVLLGKRALNVRAGVRYDVQNGYGSIGPRINTNYELSDGVRVGVSYGLSYKSPSLAQRYPGPIYNEVPLVVSYNGKVAESMYLVYVHRFDPSAAHLKPVQGATLEFSTQMKLGKGFDLSMSFYDKKIRQGITTVAERISQIVPTYTAIPRPGQRPDLQEGAPRTASFFIHPFRNDLRSDNQGIDLILSSPTVEPLATRFLFSGGVTRTFYRKSSHRFGSPLEELPGRPDYAVMGIYRPEVRESYLSNARISTVTHIPRISLIVNFTADFALLQKTVLPADAGIPLGYLTRDGRTIYLTGFDPGNPDYGHLVQARSEQLDNDVPGIFPNFHLNIAKEIRKRFRFSFNVYNVFNYQPSYMSSGGSYRYPNASPSFGAEISIKL